MEVIGWLILGGFAGWVAGKLVRGSGSGVLINIVVGIVGAVLGGWLASAIFNVNVSSGFNAQTLAVAVIGAVILLGVANLVGLGKPRS